MELLNLTSIKKYLNESELVDGAKKVWNYAESHLTTALRIGLIVYGALVIYDAVFMAPSNPFEELGTIDDIKNWLFLAARLGICVIGLCGEFLGYRICLKVFIVLVCIDGLVGIITVVLSDPTGVLAISNRQNVEQMWAAQSNYDWAPNSKLDDDSADSKKVKNMDLVMETTEVWDSLQSSGCCGVDGYNNWDRLRPDSYPEDSYPSSCCDNANVTLDSDPSVLLCGKESVYLTGCRQTVEEAESSQMTMTFWIGVFEIGLAIIAYQIYKHCDPDQPSYEQMRNHQNLMRMHMHSPYNQPIMPSLKGSKDNSRYSRDSWKDHEHYGSTNNSKDTYIISGSDKFTP